MRILPTFRPALSRYLTPFYLFALGLVFTLVLSACSRQATEAAASPTVTRPSQVSTPLPTQESTPEPILTTPTPLPAIPPTPNEKTPSALGVSSDELSGLTVNFWHPWTGAQEAQMQAILAEFNRTNRWGISVQGLGYEGYGRLDEALETALASGTLPDIVVDYGYQARHLDDSAALEDLTPYVSDPTWGWTEEEQAAFYPGFWNEDVATIGSSDRTGRLGIPYYRSAYVLFYNQSWARELGYSDAPITPQDFHTQACAAASDFAKQDKSIPGKGGWLVTPQPGVLAGWIYAFGGQITNADASGYLFNTPETQKALEYIKDLDTSHCAWYDTALNPLEEFASRGALFIVGSLFDIPAQQEAIARANTGDEWVIIPFPSIQQPVVVTYGPSLMLVHSTPPKQLAAWLVLEWLVYPRNQAEWVSGLETYPTRESSLAYLEEAAAKNPHWSQALKLIPDARSEPSLPSWSIMRWALQDALVELIDPKVEAEKIPSMLENLDAIGSEVVKQVR